MSSELISGEQYNQIICNNELFFNPLTAKKFDYNFHPLEVMSRWRDPQLQVSANYSDFTSRSSTIYKSCWLMSRFVFNMFKCLKGGT